MNTTPFSDTEMSFTETTQNFNTLFTSTYVPDDGGWSSDNPHEIIWTTLHCIIAIVGMAGNMLVFIVIMKIKDRGQSTNINLLILNQSIIDLLTSVILFAANISDYVRGTLTMPEGVLGRILCGVWYSRFVLFSLFAASTFNIMMMAIERYYAVVRPHSYNFNKRNTFIPIVTVWVMAPLMQIYPAVSQWGIKDGVCSWLPPPSFAVGITTGVLVFLYEFFIPLITMTYMYATIVMKLRESARKVRVSAAASSDVETLTRNMSTTQTQMSTVTTNASTSKTNSYSQEAGEGSGKIKTFTIVDSNLDSQNTQTSNSREILAKDSNLDSQNTQASSRQAHGTNNSNHGTCGNEKKKTKVSRNITVTILMVVLMFALLWTPNHVTFLVINFGVYVPFDSIGYQLTVVLAFCNQCINPILYGLKYKPFQSELKKMFCGY